MQTSPDRRYLCESELLGKGAAARLFSFALKSFNLELARKTKLGRRKYFTKADARYAWLEYQGACAFCGYFLKPYGKGQAENTLHFTMYCPLDGGGKIEKENLLPVCVKCKKGSKPPPRRAFQRVEGYNTVADLIVLLMDAVLDGQEEIIPILKRELNQALTEFALNLRYAPAKSETQNPVPVIVMGQNTLSDWIEKNQNVIRDRESWAEISELFRSIRVMRKYEPVRK
jgi:hypothetical protein